MPLKIQIAISSWQKPHDCFRDAPKFVLFLPVDLSFSPPSPSLSPRFAVAKDRFLDLLLVPAAAAVDEAALSREEPVGGAAA